MSLELIKKIYLANNYVTFQNEKESRNGYFFSYAREAIYFILKNHSVTKVIIPKFICKDVIDKIINLNLEVIYYEVDKNLKVVMNTLPSETKDSILLVVNYFGFPTNVSELIEFSRENKVEVIVDNAQSYLSFYSSKSQENFGNYEIYSFRKTIPVPEGAELRINSGELKNKSLKLASNFKDLLDINVSKLKFRKLLKFIPLNLFLFFLNLKRKFSKLNEPSLLCSEGIGFKRTLLPKVDIKEHINLKRQLYVFIRNYLSNQDLSIDFVGDFTKETVPTCLPMIIELKEVEKVRAKLKKINCDLVKWPDFYDQKIIEPQSFYNNFYFVPFVW